MADDTKRDDLLWDAARAGAVGRQTAEEVAGASAEPDPWSDEDLEAYRRDALDSGRRDALEDALIADASLRERLASSALGGSEPAVSSLADARARRRVLEAFDRELGRGEPDAGAADAKEADATPADETAGRVVVWRRPWAVAPAVAALAALLVLAVLWTREPPGLPGDLAYRVEARGLAEVRGSDGAPRVVGPRIGDPRIGDPRLEGIPQVEPIIVRPETSVVLEASPTRAVDGVAFTLYRRNGDELLPLSLPPGALRVARGAMRLEIAAAALVGEPGTGEAVDEGVLYLVAAARTSTGSRGAARPIDVDELLADLSAGRIRAVAVPYRLLPRV